MRAVFADMQSQCLKCTQFFWVTAAEQRKLAKKKLAIPTFCPECRGEGLVSTRLPARVEKELASHLIDRRETLVADLRELLRDALAPIEMRQRTWLEWINGVDVQTLQFQQKYAATGYANSLVQQRTVLIRNLKDMIIAIGELEHVEIDTQLKLLQGRVALQRLETEQFRLEAERLKLEEEIAQRLALRDGRIETLQLEETSRQAELLAQLQPPPPPEKPKDPVKQAIANHRGQLRAKATAKQCVISDFLRDLQKIFRANVEDTEKAARIRAVLEAYKQEREALPRSIREFLDQVELQEGAHID